MLHFARQWIFITLIFKKAKILATPTKHSQNHIIIFGIPSKMFNEMCLDLCKSTNALSLWFQNCVTISFVVKFKVSALLKLHHKFWRPCIREKFIEWPGVLKDSEIFTSSGQWHAKRFFRFKKGAKNGRELLGTCSQILRLICWQLNSGWIFV